MLVFNQDYRQQKQFLPGTRRSRSPSDTLRDFGRFMPTVGITRLANVTGLDCIGIPVIQAVRPNSRSLSVSQGKGVDVDAAKVSAMMEATELWHAENIHLPLRNASYEDLRKLEKVVDIFQLTRAKGSVVRPEVQRTWILGWDLIQEEEVWVPFEIVNMNTIGQVVGSQTFCCNSNGLASGNHLLEAIEHALCEVIERDTHAVYWAKGFEASLKSKIDLSSIQDASLRDLLSVCTAAGVEVSAFAMDSDVGLPAYCVGMVDHDDRAVWRRLGIQWGAGCHLSPVVAMSRALTEAAQARLTIIAGSRDDNPPQAYQSGQDMETIARARASAFGAACTRQFSASVQQAETDSFEGDLAVMLNAIQAVGIERAIVVNLTKPELNIPVVKVVVPGLEGPPFVPDYTEGLRARRVKQELS